jgi:hypothetical protein
MRALVVHPGPAFSVADVFEGWREGLEANGVTTATFNLDERLTFYNAVLLETREKGQFRKALTVEQAKQLAINGLLSTCYQFLPDVVLVVSGFFLEPDVLDLLRSRGHKVVLLHTESPYEDQRQLALSEHADLTLLNDPVSLDAYRALGPAQYMPHAYRPSIHHPGPGKPELKSDLAFVGTGYLSRVLFLERMALDGLDVLLAGNWQRLTDQSPLRQYVAHELDECLDNTETAEVYRSARIGLNLYRREGEQAAGVAIGPREVEMAACGLFYLRDPRPEGDELFPMLPTFANPEQASEQLRWWLGRDAAREKAADLARRAVAERTFENNAAALLRLLDK